MSRKLHLFRVVPMILFLGGKVFQLAGEVWRGARSDGFMGENG